MAGILPFGAVFIELFFILSVSIILLVLHLEQSFNSINRYLRWSMNSLKCMVSQKYYPNPLNVRGFASFEGQVGAKAKTRGSSMALVEKIALGCIFLSFSIIQRKPTKILKEISIT